MPKIKDIRLQKKMTQKQMSEKSGLVQQELSRFEKLPNVDNVTLKSLCKLAKGLDVKIWDIVESENIIDMLHENISYDTGIILDGDKPPLAEILQSFDLQQNELFERCEISVTQLSRWKCDGMDNATLINFLKIGNALKINVWSLIWDEDLQSLFCEVI
jgi:transcriptional regulator with XRE-family HTH domain